MHGHISIYFFDKLLPALFVPSWMWPQALSAAPGGRPAALYANARSLRLPGDRKDTDPSRRTRATPVGRVISPASSSGSTPIGSEKILRPFSGRGRSTSIPSLRIRDNTLVCITARVADGEHNAARDLGSAP